MYCHFITHASCLVIQRCGIFYITERERTKTNYTDFADVFLHEKKLRKIPISLL